MKLVSVLFFFIYLFYAGECHVPLPFSLTNSRWIWFPDGNGFPHLINLYETEDVRDAADVVKDITFQLYTRLQPTTYTPLKPTEDADVGDFRNERKTTVIIHGWHSNGKNMASIREGYLEAGDYNVVVVDWSKPASSCYLTSKHNGKLVGEHLATMIDFLVRNHGLRVEDVHIVGHSLGAHAAGVAGSRMETGKPGRITGLDPAKPLYWYEALENRLDVTDAQFVEVIHTCAGRLGWKNPMGHVDFYPNGGTSRQPGCGFDLGGTCSHSRAHAYFAESITSITGFNSHKCSSWKDYRKGMCLQNPSTFMGEFTDISSRGSYYLKTAGSSPYALGDTTTLAHKTSANFQGYN